MLIHVPPEVTVLAMDVHKNTISTAVLEPGSTSPLVDKISTDDEMVRRLMTRFPDRHRVWACYEAGPTGYDPGTVCRCGRSAGRLPVPTMTTDPGIAAISVRHLSAQRPPPHTTRVRA